MAKSKDPAVLFYTRDFLADTVLWKYDELGRYIKLLCLQHLQDGISEEDFKSIAGKSQRVIEKFDLCEDGLYRDSRMTAEMLRRSSYVATLRENGLKGGRPKKKDENQKVFFEKPKGFEKQNQNESTRVANVNANRRVNKEIREYEREEEKKRTQIDVRFDAFWSIYPKKVGKQAAYKSFIKINPSEQLTQTMLDALDAQKKSLEWTKDGGQYIPHPATWLNQGRWDDELTSVDNQSFVPRYSEFDGDEAFKQALERSYQ